VLWAVLRAVIEEEPDRPVFIGEAGSQRAADLLDVAQRLADALGDRMPDGRVAVISDDYPLAFASVLACLFAHRTVGMISSALPTRLIHSQIGAFNPTLILATAACAETVLGDQFKVLSTGSTRSVGDVVVLEREAFSPVPDGGPFIAFFTSGTSGASKVVAHTERSLLAAYRLVRAIRFELLSPAVLSTMKDPLSSGVGPRSWYGSNAGAGFPMRYLSAMPVATIGGFGLGIQALLGGELIVSKPIYQPGSLLDATRRFGVTSLGASPGTGQALIRVAQKSRRLRPDLMVLGLGGSAVPSALHEQLESAFRCKVVTGYGSTELGGVVTTTRFTDSDTDRWSTVGRPVPGVALQIDPAGELMVVSPAIAAGYLATDGGLAPLCRSDGWYKTGDRLICNENGSYRFGGRMSGLIVRGGRKINPEDIERVLQEHDTVEMAGVVGVPSRVAGEEDIVAGVVPCTEGLSISALVRHCAEELGRAMTPRTIQTFEELPMTPQGVLDRPALRRLLMTG
jgi:acyl-CoA synthetase (AMP-forming)/AMP-acid ligase II